jgi:hypothetical protein
MSRSRRPSVARLTATFAAITVLLVAACSVSSSARPTAPGFSFEPEPSAWAPRSTWERRLAAIQPDGTYAVADALALFATAYGPLPGVDAVQDPAGITDRTAAIHAVKARWAELTDEQRRAIDAYLQFAHGPDTIVINPKQGAFRSNVVLAASIPKTIQDEIRALALDAADLMDARLGGLHLPGKINVNFLDTQGPASPYGSGYGVADGDAWSDFPGGVFGDCNIRIYANAADESRTDLDMLIVHEVFHCFQLAFYRTIEGYATAPHWLIEGGAEWAATDVTLGASPWWDPYIQAPTSLTMEVYDAVGWFGHLKEVGRDPWTRFTEMWAAGRDSVAIVKAAGADDDVFIDGWASSRLRQPARGIGWWTPADGFTTAVNVPPQFVVIDGSRIDLGMAALDNGIRLLGVGSDFVHITAEGHVRLSDGKLDILQVSDAWFCIEGHKCDVQCTNGEAPPPIANTVGPLLAIASSGGIDGTIGTAEGVDAKDVCASPEPSPTGDEFCIRYKAMLAWAAPYQGDVTREVAAGVATRMKDARPYAPAELVADVDLYIKVYGKFATYPGPGNVPIVGPDAAGIADAFRAMNTYCGIPY